MKAYDFIEVFCGHAWVSRVMRGAGRNTAQMDILMSTKSQLSSAQNPMDLRTDAGFLHLDWCYDFTRLCLKYGLLKSEHIKKILHMVLDAALHSTIEWLGIKNPKLYHISPKGLHGFPSHWWYVSYTHVDPIWGWRWWPSSMARWTISYAS